MKILHCLLLIYPIILSAQPAKPVFVTDSLDVYINRSLKDWNLPGCAVAIIKDGHIVLTKGYGLRDVEKNLPVDEHSLFMIASNSKAVTGLSLAKLEQEKKLSLDDKVQKWLPWFKLYDPNASNLVTLKDVVTHRIGFETFQGDFCHWATSTTREEVIRRMAVIPPIYQFRDKWGYCNAGYVVAGEVIKKASGLSWEDYIQENYFKPMGMTETKALTRDFEQIPNHCTPYTIYLDKLTRLKIPQIDNLAPAASICSSVSDWAKWLKMILDKGQWNGSQILPEAAINRTMTPVSIRGNFRPPFNTGHFSMYGIGWDIVEYCGRKMVSHTGGADGFVTSVSLIPEERLGIIVFTNSDANAFYQALKWEITDAYLDKPYRNYSAVYLKNNENAAKKDREWYMAVKDSVAKGGLTPIPIAKYAGVYQNTIYGEVVLKTEGKNLRMTMEHHPDQSALLEYMGSDRFLCTYTNPTLGIKVFPFVLKKNKVQSFTLSCADFVEFTNYQFIKKH